MKEKFEASLLGSSQRDLYDLDAMMLNLGRIMR